MRTLALACLLALLILTPTMAAKPVSGSPRFLSAQEQCSDPYDPNETIATAYNLAVDTSQRRYDACVNGGDSWDYYRVQIPACQTFHLYAQYQGPPGETTLHVEILAVDGSDVLWWGDTGAYTGSAISAAIEAAEASTFYVQAYAPASVVIPYTLTLWREPCSVPSPTPTPTPEEPAELVVRHREAERGAVQAPMTVRYASAASSCGYVASDTGESGSVQIAFDVPSTANYYLWARATAADYNHNSFFYAWDGGAEVWYEVGRVGADLSWGWERVKDGPFYLTAGSHTLRLRAREAGARLDAVLLTNSYPYRAGMVQPCATATPSPTPVVTTTPQRVYLPCLLSQR